MIRLKHKAVLAPLVLVAMLAAGPAMPALAAQSTDDDDSRVIAWYLDHGVTEEVAESLVTKFNSGQLLDSMEEGAIPVKVVTSSTASEDITTSTFEDGSVSVVGIEKPQPLAPGARGIGACGSVQSGTGYTSYRDCDIWGSNSYLEVHFRANYTRSGGTNGSIESVGSPYQYATGGNATTPDLSITRRASSTAGPATAVAVTQYSSATTSFTARLYLKVAATATTSTDGL